MNKKTLGVIGLAKRAGKLAVSTANVLEAIRGGKAELVLIASDASCNTKKSISDKASYYSVRYEIADITVGELGHITGRGEAAAAAFTDDSFVKAYEQSLAADNTDETERGM